MSNFLTRLHEEHSQLEERHHKLSAFLKSGKFENVDPAQVDLMIIQVTAMETYLLCLNQRLRGLRSQESDEGSNPPHGPGTPP